jgi:hypothetical protein
VRRKRLRKKERNEVAIIAVLADWETGDGASYNDSKKVLSSILFLFYAQGYRF